MKRVFALLLSVAPTFVFADIKINMQERGPEVPASMYGVFKLRA